MFWKKSPQQPNIEIETERSIIDLISPAGLKIESNYFQVGEKYGRTIFVFTFPRLLITGWFSPVITLDREMNISLFIHPAETNTVLKNLKKKVAQIQSQMTLQAEKGKVRDPILEGALRDVENLRDQLIQGRERFFKFGLYATFLADSVKDLDSIENEVRALLETKMVYTKPAVFQQEQGFMSTLPLGEDKLGIHNSLNTSPISSIFPFVSMDLSDNKGVLYGINRHNNSLILFDRFSLENANLVLFGKSGGGKSIDKNEPVLCKINGGVQLIKIGSLVEKIIKKRGIDFRDRDLEGKTFPGIKVYTFNKDLKGQWSEVKLAARTKAPKLLYKFTTKSQREIITTGDHNMLVLKNGKIVAMKSSEVKIGGFVPLPRKIYLPKPSQSPKNIPFPITNQFLRFIGYLTSEGWVGENSISIRNWNKEIIKDIISFLKKTDIRFRENEERHEIIIYGREFIQAIKKLGGQGTSGKKKVLPFIFNLEKVKIAQYLSAYFEGDGGVEEHEITITSKSKRLISEIVYLLYYFGIIGRISRTKKKATNYNWKRKRTYYKLIISGQDNLKRFAKNIGFVSSQKQKKLLGLLNKKFNTNVDVVPGVDSVLKEIYQLFKPAHQYFQLSGIQSISPLRRGVFKPSPKFLKKIIKEIEIRIENLRKFDSQINLLNRLPSLAWIIEQGKNNRHFNSLLWQKLGASWPLIRSQKVNPGCQNVFKAIQTINGCQYDSMEMKNTIWLAFKNFGLSMKGYHPCLREFLINPSGLTSYTTLKKAAEFINQQYQILARQLEKVEEKLALLKTLANSDLFWDPITKIQKIKNKDKYVYDLTVDNEVFLAGKGGMFVHNSYAIKLEILRSLMLGTECIIIDPEKEYKYLAEATGGTFIDISLGSSYHLNPFDLPLPGPDDKPADLLRSNIINLVSLLRIMLGGLTPAEDAILDKALAETYAAKDITPESDFKKIAPPLMQDLYTILKSLKGGEGLATRLEKYVSGSYAGFFNQPTNVELKKKLVVFSIRDMEEELRPLAMYVILHYIWNIVRSERKKRMVVVDEAWWMMQHEDGASFLFGIAKRARKYWLGLTTITQDIPDFMNSPYGKPIVTNSSLQLLMKQSPATIEVVAKTFNLTEQERYMLLESNVGEGIFFAGLKHVAIQVVASYTEDQIITSDPAQLAEIEAAKQELAKEES